MLLETILALQCVQGFISGLRMGKFVKDYMGFKHENEIKMASKFINRAIDHKDQASAKEAIKWFGKVQLDELAYFKALSFYGIAVCNTMLENYVVAHQYCIEALDLDPSLYKDSVAAIKKNARELKNAIEANNLLEGKPIDDHPTLPPPSDNEHQNIPIQTENAGYIINSSLNETNLNGIKYFKLEAEAPSSILSSNHGKKLTWVHGDNNCGGLMYIGDDGSITCGKCGNALKATSWRFESTEVGIGKLFSSNKKVTEESELVALAGSMISSTGIEWFNKFIESLNK